MKLLNRQIIYLIFGCLVIFQADVINAQCPDRPGKPVLRNQEAIDSFLAIYPNCTNYIEGTMSVNGVPIHWVYEDVKSYLLTLVGLLILILGLLKILFTKVNFFQE